MYPNAGKSRGCEKSFSTQRRHFDMSHGVQITELISSRRFIFMLLLLCMLTHFHTITIFWDTWHEQRYYECYYCNNTCAFPSTTCHDCCGKGPWRLVEEMAVCICRYTIGLQSLSRLLTEPLRQWKGRRDKLNTIIANRKAGLTDTMTHLHYLNGFCVSWCLKCWC